MHLLLEIILEVRIKEVMQLVLDIKLVDTIKGLDQLQLVKGQDGLIKE